MKMILTKRLSAWGLSHSKEHGQGLVEYALLLLLIAVACLVAVGSFGQTTLRELWGPIEDTVLPALGLR